MFYFYFLLIGFDIPEQNILVNSPRTTDPSCEVVPAHVAVISEGIESVLTSPSPPVVPHRRHKRALQPTQVPASSRASVVFPILAGGNPFGGRRHQDDGIGYGTLRDEGAQKQGPHEGKLQAGSDPSVCSQSSPELANSPPYHHPIGEIYICRVFGNFLERSRTFGNFLELSKTFKNIPEFSRIFYKYSKLIWNLPKCLVIRL